MKTILVTGGAGFLGRHLCAKLLEDPNNFIFCLDNLITGKESNIDEFKNNPNFKFIYQNIIDDIESIETNLCINNVNLQINEIYHLASIASPDKYKKYSIETIMVNFQGTKNVLDLEKKYSAKVLLTSTSEVYGDPLIHPQTENYYGNVNTVGERSCYDESKRIAETLMYEYRKKFNDISFLKFFYIKFSFIFIMFCFFY